MEEAETGFNERLEAVNTKMTQELDLSIEKRISNLSDESEGQLKEVSSKATGILEQAQSELDRKEVDFEELNLLYEGKANKLIEEITSESTQVTTIYDELQSIQETNREYQILLDSSEEKSKSVFENMKQEFDTVIQAGKSSTMISSLEALEKKLKRLEKYAHRHSFAGTPI